MEKHTEVMAACHLAYERHQQQVMVVGQIGLLEYRGKLKLVGGNLIVAGLGRDAETVALYLQVEHERLDTRRYGTEIVVLKLLVLG